MRDNYLVALVLLLTLSDAGCSARRAVEAPPDMSLGTDGGVDSGTALDARLELDARVMPDADIAPDAETDATVLVDMSADDDAAPSDAGPSMCPAGTAVSGSTCVPVGMLSEHVYLKASNTGSLDLFGSEVALSADGNSFAVAATYEDSTGTGVGGVQLDNSGDDVGAVYVFRRASPASEWGQDAYLKPAYSATEQHFYFGSGLAFSADGNTLAVGSCRDPLTSHGVGATLAAPFGDSVGAAYVFRRNAGGWALEAFVKASNADEFDEFGWSVALSSSGDVLAVGARGESSTATGVGGDQTSNARPASGAVYVFRRSESIWTQEAYVKAPNPGNDDGFGYDVGLSGDGSILIASAILEDSGAIGVDGSLTDESASNAGAVYVYRHLESGWAYESYLKASSVIEDSEFGRAVSIAQDGGTIAVGCIRQSEGAPLLHGVGPELRDSGAVYLYVHDDAGWRQEAVVKSNNTDENTLFGYAVALSGSGDRLATSAIFGTSPAGPRFGAAYLFQRSDGIWTQTFTAYSPNNGEGDYFGQSGSISGDGSTMAFGAIFEDSNATGIGGDATNNASMNSGAAYIFSL